MPITAATVGTIAALGAAEAAAPLIGQGIASLGAAGRERRAMFREAIARRQSGKYGMSRAEKDQLQEDLAGTPSAGDTTGSVGVGVGPSAGRLAAANQAKLREAMDMRAKARGKVNELSQQRALAQKTADDQLINQRALDAQKLGAAIADTAVAAGTGAYADVKEGREARARQGVEAILELDPAAQAAAKTAASTARAVGGVG
tara:strand:- start:3170 stop:3778 length:609 start_codon:yes stop_codon:yes gene_type:complete